jgi:hypothetical protein
VFPVRYELDLYILFGEVQSLKGSFKVFLLLNLWEGGKALNFSVFRGSNLAHTKSNSKALNLRLFACFFLGLLFDSGDGGDIFP